jgi:hypothetical protein
MKLIEISAFALLFSRCEAFAPLRNACHIANNKCSTHSRRTNQSLKAQTLEGWKIDGKIKPVNNFILIKKAEDQKQTETGILLSKTVRISIGTT